MTITFFSSFLNHHQSPFCDIMYSRLGDKFTFVSTTETPGWILDGGYPDCSGYAYNLKSYLDKESFSKAMQLGIDSDIVIIGAAPEIFVTERIRENKHTFRYSERFLRKPQQLIDPRFIAYMLLYHTRYRYRNLYMLCAGLYTARNLKLFMAYPDKKYKWGYFTKVEDIDIDDVIYKKPSERIELLWTSRFIPLKHPELPVKLARELKKHDYNFHLTMIGTGEMMGTVKKLTEEWGLQDHIDLPGNMPNAEVLDYMRKANIFLFTSDMREGWGAVLNEAMSNGCAVVASHSIGAVPYLITHNKNGLIFRSSSLSDLYYQTVKLLKDKSFADEIGRNAYSTVKNEWSPVKAARNFIRLSESILYSRPSGIVSGPCSPEKSTRLYLDRK